MHENYSNMDTNAVESYDEDTNDQPVDYSKKYMERNAMTQNHLDDNPQTHRASKKEFREREAKVDLFGDYAETDLDQPTDYSLRYAEDDTDEDEKQSPEYFAGSIQEDTIKTYCTEGTPYETPFNFSTATSMSDLRVEDAKENDILKKVPKKIDIGHKDPVPFKGVLRCDERQHCKEHEVQKSVLNHGQVTPEKIVHYYEEVTPDTFSRANSLSSLSSAMTQQNNPQMLAKETLNNGRSKVVSETTDTTARLNNNGLRLVSESNSSLEGKSNGRVVDKEGKMVTFGGQDFYAEQTPLMFSRCSSLGSLSGFEQHSIHDDRSSIVSDFSRRTSGVVSPSELPDSPTQTIPPSPCNHKAPTTDFISKIQEEAVRPSLRHLSYTKPQITRGSVFEDDIATFKEESTPIEFSTATSLSSLTIDDELKTDCPKPQCSLQESSSSTDKEAKKEILSTAKSNNTEEKDQEQVSDGDEDDEDMLAACISMGMQNNRYRQSFKTSNIQKVHSEPGVLTRYQRNSTVNRLEPRVPTTAIETPSTASKPKSAMEIVVVPADTVHVYCTEDTPADISPVGSQSNLSALSMPSVQEDVEKIEEKSPEIECHRNDLSDESSNLSGEDEKILDECIQSGMPKVRQITPPPASCIPFVKKCEKLTQKFNICGTPSSSPVETAQNNKAPMISKSLLCRTPMEPENDISDDSPNHSDDEAILTECIESAMPKARLSISPLVRPPPAKSVEKSKAPNLRNSSTLPSYQLGHMEQNKNTTKKPPAFEDNLSLSEEEEDIILAQCIRSGMPKALNATSAAPLPPKKPEQPLKIMNTSGASQSYLINKTYPTRPSITANSQLPYKPEEANVTTLLERTTSQFNRLSIKPAETSRHPTKNGIIYHEKANVSSCRRHTDVENRSTDNFVHPRSQISRCKSPMLDNDEDECRNAMKSNVVPSRQSSASSLSEEGSLGSIEEWALLDFCISSGMPRNKYRVKRMKSNEGTMSHNHEDCDTATEDNYSVCSYNSYVCKTLSMVHAQGFGDGKPNCT